MITMENYTFITYNSELHKKIFFSDFNFLKNIIDNNDINLFYEKNSNYVSPFFDIVKYNKTDDGIKIFKYLIDNTEYIHTMHFLEICHLLNEKQLDYLIEKFPILYIK